MFDTGGKTSQLLGCSLSTHMLCRRSPSVSYEGARGVLADHQESISHRFNRETEPSYLSGLGRLLQCSKRAYPFNHHVARVKVQPSRWDCFHESSCWTMVARYEAFHRSKIDNDAFH